MPYDARYGAKRDTHKRDILLLVLLLAAVTVLAVHGGIGHGDRLSDAQLDGLACATCGADLTQPGTVSVPAGHGPRGQMFACAEHGESLPIAAARGID